MIHDQLSLCYGKSTNKTGAGRRSASYVEIVLYVEEVGCRDAVRGHIPVLPGPPPVPLKPSTVDSISDSLDVFGDASEDTLEVLLLVGSNVHILGDQGPFGLWPLTNVFAS